MKLLAWTFSGEGFVIYVSQIIKGEYAYSRQIRLAAKMTKEEAKRFIDYQKSIGRCGFWGIAK